MIRSFIIGISILIEILMLMNVKDLMKFARREKPSIETYKDVKLVITSILATILGLISIISIASINKWFMLIVLIVFIHAMFSARFQKKLSDNMLLTWLTCWHILFSIPLKIYAIYYLLWRC